MRPGIGNSFEGRKCYIACLPEVFLQLANDATATDIYRDFLDGQIVIAAKPRRGTAGNGQTGKHKG